MKRIATLLFFAVSLLAAITATAQNEVNIIPKPAEIIMQHGCDFIFDSQIKIFHNSEASGGIARMLQNSLRELYDFEAAVNKSGKRKGGVNFLLSYDFAAEHYRMTITEQAIVIEGGVSGLFYGLQSLMQILPPGGFGPIPCLTINDGPRFAYRGAMLDVGRYYYPADYIKRYIDLASKYKINTFHWHLTEDSGWRIEIEKYPQITYYGAYRRGTNATRGENPNDRLPVGGYYTRREMKEIVEYARERNVTIIPEIDMPGHTMALLAAFPEISCRGERIIPTEYWGIQKDVLCAGNPDTYRIVFDILDELIEIFPSGIIHIGGDEAPKDRWKECPKCQTMIKERGLKDEDELQSYFIRQLSDYLASKGRRIMGWDEILEGGLAPGAIVMSWRGEAGGITAARMGHEVVMAPTTHMYHDYYQGDHRTEPLNIFEHTFTPLDKVYHYEPCSEKIPAEYRKYVIGVQGNMWSEYIHKTEKVEYMAYPRLLALAEVGWSSPEKDWNDFRRRLKSSLATLESYDVNFRIPEPIGLDGGAFGSRNITVTLEEPVDGAIIMYSTDGRDPLRYGDKYTRPIELALTTQTPTTLKCVVKTRKGRVSGIYEAIYTFVE